MIFNKLGPDEWSSIFSFLTLKDLISFSSCNKYTKLLIKNKTKNIYTKNISTLNLYQILKIYFNPLKLSYLIIEDASLLKLTDLYRIVKYFPYLKFLHIKKSGFMNSFIKKYMKNKSNNNSNLINNNEINNKIQQDNQLDFIPNNNQNNNINNNDDNNNNGFREWALNRRNEYELDDFLSDDDELLFHHHNNSNNDISFDVDEEYKDLQERHPYLATIHLNPTTTISSSSSSSSSSYLLNYKNLNIPKTPPRKKKDEYSSSILSPISPYIRKKNVLKDLPLKKWQLKHFSCYGYNLINIEHLTPLFTSKYLLSLTLSGFPRMSDNQLETLINNLINLKICKINFCPSLYEPIINSNKLEILYITHCSLLINVKLNTPNLIEINLSNNTSLSSNIYTSLNNDNFIYLKTIKLNHCFNILEFKLIKLNYLKSLSYISSSNISNGIYEFIDCSKLTTLILINSFINELNLTSCYSLNTLALDIKPIKILNLSLLPLTYLEIDSSSLNILLLNGCNNLIPENTFINCENLLAIELCDCPLSNISLNNILGLSLDDKSLLRNTIKNYVEEKRLRKAKEMEEYKKNDLNNFSSFLNNLNNNNNNNNSISFDNSLLIKYDYHRNNNIALMLNDCLLLKEKTNVDLLNLI